MDSRLVGLYSPMQLINLMRTSNNDMHNFSDSIRSFSDAFILIYKASDNGRTEASLE